MKKILLTLWNLKTNQYCNESIAIDEGITGWQKVDAIYTALAHTKSGESYLSPNSFGGASAQLKEVFVITNVHDLN